MKRIIWIACIVVVAVSAWMYEPVTAQDTSPTMQVTVGYDGYCRAGDSGSWCPVYVMLSNEGADVEGELRVRVSGTMGGTRPNLYTRPVVLPAHSRKEYFLYVPATSTSSGSHLTVQLIANDKVLASQQAPVEWMGERNRLYGVASSSPSALNFLSDVVPAGGRAEVAHLALEALPPDPLGWESLDVLILNDVDTTVLDGNQRRALETWLAHGGHLIVGGGAGVARTVAGVADLLPVTVGGTRSVDDLRALGEWVGAASTVEGPYAVAEVNLRDGEAVVTQEQEERLTLLARRPFGAGGVDFLAFDAGLKPFTLWDDNGRLWHLIVGAKSASERRFAVYDGYSAREAVNAIPGIELPSTLQILGFMLMYTILIGPVNYVFLRKLDRRELAWLTIPVLILGFSACAYLTGFQIRGGTAIVHRLAVVYVPEGSVVGRVSQAVGLFSPRRTTYDVQVVDAGVRELPENYYGGGGPASQPLHVIEEASGLTVSGLRVDVGGIQPFVVEGYTNVPEIDADLRLVIDNAGMLQLEGIMRNGDTLLQGAVLIAGGDEESLGDLDAGQEVPVKLLLRSGGSLVTPKPWSSVSPAYGYNIPERILGPGDYWSDRALYRRHQFLQALFPHNGPGLPPGIYLVGWAEEDVPLPVEVVDRPFSSMETALYVYALPVTELATNASIIIPPNLITRQVDKTEGSVSVWPEGCHMEAESVIEYRFIVWQGMMVEQVEELVLDIQGSSYGNLSHAPTISLWNRDADDWEPMPDLGWGRHLIPDADAYVLPSGDVLVRLETDTEWGAEVNSITVTIKGRR
ncbi:MAG: hypothetical protein GY832_40310 [Chloroflexi bacterium]|nr:hypothetical protein [Chloroflexota bacterium]